MRVSRCASSAWLWSCLLVLQQLSLCGAILDEPFSSSFSQLEHAPCTRLFYRNGALGCGTESRDVAKGKLVYFEGAQPDSSEGFVAVLEDYDLTADNLDILLNGQVSSLQGILVLNSTSSNSNRSNKYSIPSPDSNMPQGYGTPSQLVNYGSYSYAWNSKGQGIFNYDLYGVAMAFVPDSDVSQSIRQNALGRNQNSKKNNVVAEFNYYMGPQEMNSFQCLQWKDEADQEWNPKCLPLGGTSVWALAGSPPESNLADNSYNSNNNYNNNRPVVLISAAMDATSLFHDLTPGANTAASNILTVLMAARLIGANVNDEKLDGLPKTIAFALFQGESYGFIGSRSFLRDVAYPGFSCNGSLVPNSQKQNDQDDNNKDYACLYPLRPSMKFADMGQVSAMLAVDQVGHAVADGILYAHADPNNDSNGYWLANLLKYCSTDDVSVAYSSAGNSNDGNDGNGYPYPPSPLTSLLQLSEGAVGGAVLTGFDYSFTNKVAYHSHLDSALNFDVELNSIAAAATMMARAALAYAYDDGSYYTNNDAQTPTAYAKNLIPELDADDELLVELAQCLFYDGGQCSLIQKYAKVEAANSKAKFGINVNNMKAFPQPPNYFVGVYNYYYGQPFVQVGDRMYGAYNGSDYGQHKSDAVTLMPRQLESALHGLFNDFLGRGSINSNGDNYAQDCKKTSDCAKVEYCDSDGDAAVCTGGGQCVCERAHYHMALDEALVAAPNEPTGFFNHNANTDWGFSPMYTEPYWSPSVGVLVYRAVGPLPGIFTLAAGVVVGAASGFAALVLKVGLKKEKLY